MQSVRNHASRNWSFIPHFIAESVAQVDFKKLSSLGVKAVFIDLDGTVVERDQYVVHELVQAGLKQQRLKVYIATNRPASKDLRNLRELLNATGVIHPNGPFGKPSKKYFRHGLQLAGLQPHQVAMIGDRYVQDILGGNRVGMWTIAVRKLGEPVSAPDRIVSYLERHFTAYLSKRVKQYAVSSNNDMQSD